MSGSISLSGPFELSNLTAPASGITKALRFSLVLPSGGGTVTLDMSNYIQQLGSFRPQAMTVDNSLNNTPITINEIQFGWNRTVNAGQLVTFNYPAVPLPKFTFTTGATASPTITLYDFPQFPETGFNAGIGASQNVVVSNTPLPVSLPSPYTANKGNYNTNIYNNVISATAAIGTAGLNTYVLGYDFSVSGNASIAAAGENIFELAAGSIVVFKNTIFLPAAAGTSGLIVPVISNRFDYPMLINLGATPTLTLTSTNALATGHYNLNLFAVDM